MDGLKPLNEMTDAEREAELEGYIRDAFKRHVALNVPVNLLEDAALFAFTLKDTPKQSKLFENYNGNVFVCGEEHQLFFLAIDRSKLDLAQDALRKMEADFTAADGNTPIEVSAEFFELIPAKLAPFDIPNAVFSHDAEDGIFLHVEPTQTTLEFLLGMLAVYDAEADEAGGAQILRVAELFYSTYLDTRDPLSKFEKERQPYLRDYDVMVTTDPIAGALFDPGRDGYIEPGEWWDEEPKEIRSSKHGHIALQLRLPQGIQIDDEQAEQKLTATERFWYETAEKLAREGRHIIRGSDMLKKNGFSNPYRKTSAPTMADAARAMVTLTGRRIFIDTTNEYKGVKHGGMELKRQITLRPILDGEYSFTEWGDGSKTVRDFEIRLRTDNPVDAFALLGYQLEHGMFADLPGHDDCLDHMGKLTLDNRKMWREVRRRMAIENMPGDGVRGERRILFSTLFKTLDIPGTTRADEAKRMRMLDMLEKMLRRACRDDHTYRGKKIKHTRLFRSWRFIERGGRRYGVEITPLQG